MGAALAPRLFSQLFSVPASLFFFHSSFRNPNEVYPSWSPWRVETAAAIPGRVGVSPAGRRVPRRRTCCRFPTPPHSRVRREPFLTRRSLGEGGYAIQRLIFLPNNHEPITRSEASSSRLRFQISRGEHAPYRAFGTLAPREATLFSRFRLAKRQPAT